MCGKREVIYNNGTLSNIDGTAYNGKVRGFLKQVTNALDAGRTGSEEANSMIGELQESNNNFTIVKGNTNQFDYNPAQRTAAFANQLQMDRDLALTLASIPVQNMQGGAGGTITWNPNGANVWVPGGKQDIDGKGKFWKEVKRNKLVYGYANVPSNERHIFEKALTSLK